MLVNISLVNMELIGHTLAWVGQEGGRAEGRKGPDKKGELVF